MSTLYISPATSISFIYYTGAGTIHAGETIDANYEWTAQAVQDFYGCNCLQWQDYCQVYLCDDTVTFQFQFEKTGAYPIVTLLDENKASFGVTYIPTLVSTSAAGVGRYNVTINWGERECSCYYLLISSTTPNLPFAVCGQNGTFELPGGITGVVAIGTNTAFNNVGTARTGTRSLEIRASIAPIAGDDKIWYCNTITLSANTTYVVDVYMMEITEDTKWSSVESEYYWDISEFSDATSIWEQRATASNGYDTWQLVRHVFKTGGDVIGNLKMANTSLPNASGKVYFDDMTILYTSPSNNVDEAISQQICLKESIDCFIKLEWSMDEGEYAFGQDYTTAFTNMQRIPATFHQMRLDDPDRETSADSDSTALSVKSENAKIRLFHTYKTLPEYMTEKIMLALKHENLELNDINFVCIEDSITPEYESGDHDTTATVKADVRLKVYDQKTMNC